MKQLGTIVILLLFFGFAAHAQSVSEIKTDKNYYWGEGVGATPKTAEDEALSSLIKSISVNIVSATFLQGEQTLVKHRQSDGRI